MLEGLNFVVYTGRLFSPRSQNQALIFRRGRVTDNTTHVAESDDTRWMNLRSYTNTREHVDLS